MAEKITQDREINSSKRRTKLLPLSNKSLNVLIISN